MAAAEMPRGTSGAPATVFVSYSRADRSQAVPIIQALEAAGFSVWWDGLLEGGERYSQTTTAALDAAKAVVVLWSGTSADSHWVHDEATRARDRRCLVPLSIDGTPPPLGFGQFQTIDIPAARQRAEGLDQMVRAVAALHDLPAPPVSLPKRGALLARPVDRRLVLGGAVGIVGAGAAAAWWSGLIGAPQATDHSVAVLPFENMSGDPGKAYFSDGVAAEVRGELARNPLLQVAAQASSNKFRASNQDAKAIARSLGVAYLLDGNVRPSGAMVRVSAELIDGSTGFSQWSQTFDGAMADVFSVQEQIARSVAGALSAQVEKREGGSSKPDLRSVSGTTNLAAFDAYLRGRELFDRSADEAGDRAALASFDRAIAADPAYAQAYAARSRSLAVVGNQYDQGDHRKVTYAAAVDAANRAVQLAPDLADAQSALGFGLFYGRLDARAARAPFERSAALGHGDADVLSRYALFCARCGRFDAARPAIARSAALDPLNARTFRLVGEVEYSAHRYAEAIPPIRRALALNPSLSVAHASIGASLLMLGHVDEALAEYESEPNSLFKLVGTAIIARRQGRDSDAKGALDRLQAEHGDNSLYQQAQVAAQWGDKSQAVALLERAFATADAGLMYLRNDPFVDPLRTDPAFIHLLARLGFA